MKPNHQGFSLIEILLTSMFIAIVFIPLMISLSRIQNRYLNLKSHFYAQLIAQTDMEIFSNLMQGKNPPTGPYHRPISSTFQVNGNPTSGLHNTVLASPNGAVTYFRIPLPTLNNLTSLTNPTDYDSPVSLNNTSYQRRIIAYPICRDTNNYITGSSNTSCTTGTLDDKTIEIISEVKWRPQGTTTDVTSQIKTIFTAFDPTP